MKAIILAGGRGTRLWPLTSSKPKPLARVMGVPVIEHTIRALKSFGVSDIALTLGTMPQEIIGCLGDGSRMGVSLSYFCEEKPLGTAGSVKAAESFLSEEETFFVLSGDALFNLDLNEALAFHKSRSADATLVLYQTKDPSEYGVAVTNDDLRIVRFVEKPTWSRAYSDLVNTGLYVLNKSVLDKVPSGVMYDFSKDLFPRLLEENRTLLGFPGSGYWCDIGDPDAFLQCHKDILNDVGGIGKSVLSDDFWVTQGRSYFEEYEDAQIIPPVYIGNGVKIGMGASLGPYTVIGRGCDIGEGAIIRESVIMDTVTVGEGALCRGAVLDTGCVIGDGSVLGEGCVMGEKSLLQKNSSVQRGALIRPGAVVGSADGEEKGGLRITPDGAHITFGDAFSAEDALAFGFALSHHCDSMPVLLGDCGCNEASYIKSLIMSGLCAAGVSVYDTSILNYGACAYITQRIGCALGVFCECIKGSVKVTLIGGHGLPISLKVTQRLSRAYVKRKNPDFSGVKISRPSYLLEAKTLYIDEISRRYPKPGTGGIMLTGTGADFELAKRVFEKIGVATDCATSPDVYCISDGVLEIITKRNEIIRGDRLMLLCALVWFEEGEKAPFCVPECSVRELDSVASSYSRSIVRSSMRDDEVTKECIPSAQLILDPVAQVCHIACHALANNTDTDVLVRGLPNPYVSRRSIACGDAGRAHLMRRLISSGSESGELGAGVRFSRPGGYVIITPDEGASRIGLYAQGDTPEYAEELCDFFDEVIHGYIRESQGN